MKKIYVSPHTTIQLIHSRSILISMSATTINSENEDQFEYVKSNNQSASNYNVWNDDWNQ